MESLTIFSQGAGVSWIEFAIGSTVAVSWLALLIAMFALVYAKKQTVRMNQRCQQLSHDLHIAGNSAIGMGQRIIALEKKLAMRGLEATPVKQPTADRIAALQAVAKQTDVENKQESQTNTQAVHAAPLHTIKTPTQPTTADVFYQSSKVSSVKPTTKPVAPTPKKMPLKAVVDNVPEKKPALTPFEQANKLLLQGMAEDEVARRCGLSKSEAALMAMVLRQSALAG